MSKKRGLHGWIRLLEGSQAAALAGLLKELDRVTASDDSSAAQLSELILKDASLTSHIIRIGNSIQFNPSSIPVTTVSRAIINIGFKHIRSVCLAVKVMDQLLENGGGDMLFRRLAECLHAAHQTRGLCSKFNETAREEAFIASLLSNLVELLVLSSGEPVVAELERKTAGLTSDKERNLVADEVLGVRFDTLSKTLMKRWRIDGLVHQLYDPGATDERLKAISIGEAIAGATTEGVDSSAYKQALKASVKYTGKTGEEVRALLDSSLHNAIFALKEFGDPRLTDALPEDGKGSSKKSFDKASDASAEENNESAKSVDDGDGAAPDTLDASRKEQLEDTGSRSEADYVAAEASKQTSSNSDSILSPNPNLQLGALQKMSELMLGDLQIKGFFRLLLDGLHQGVGLERNAFFLLDAKQGRYSVKLVSGQKTGDWPLSLIVKAAVTEGDLLDMLFKDDQVLCVDLNKGKFSGSHQKDLHSLSYKTEADNFILAPLSAKGKKIGLLYSDMGVTKRPIDQSYLAGFQQFFLQSKLMLNVLAGR
jgi:HD-like signal output (HDOD) protein